ncbi:MAG: type II toxin-antitoxin system RelE/ParE family toxin [Xanthomonadales bacterium]|nr:type II toxin-antitoxin system RelE/ParE family toxin [Xanthomonadales bacterium]
MSSIAITFAESALADLEDSRTWYREQGVSEVGTGLVLEVFERVAALGDHPEMGRIVPEFDQPFLRELIHSPFGIVYRHDALRVRVIRIWRSERLLHLPPQQ